MLNRIAIRPTPWTANRCLATHGLGQPGVATKGSRPKPAEAGSTNVKEDKTVETNDILNHEEDRLEGPSF